MIFCSLNELGVVKADWIASLPVGSRFVTRRSKSKDVDKIVAVCPNRGKKQVCKARVVSCMLHSEWIQKNHIPDLFAGVYVNRIPWDIEAVKEGFESCEAWLSWYPAHKIDINSTYRIEMERV